MLNNTNYTRKKILGDLWKQFLSIAPKYQTDALALEFAVRQHTILACSCATRSFILLMSFTQRSSMRDFTPVVLLLNKLRAAQCHDLMRLHCVSASYVCLLLRLTECFSIESSHQYRSIGDSSNTCLCYPRTRSLVCQGIMFALVLLSRSPILIICVFLVVCLLAMYLLVTLMVHYHFHRTHLLCSF